MTGTYRLRFVSIYDDRFETEYYNDSADLASAQDIAVTAGTVTRGINATLDPPDAPSPFVSGTVTAPDGSPLAGITAIALSCDVDEPEEDCDVESDRTGVDGTYTIGVPTGRYVLKFLDSGMVYATEYFNNQHAFDDAASVRVTLAGRGGIDARLARSAGAKISGTVTYPDGSPADNVDVVAYRYSAGSESDDGFEFFNDVETHADGTYSLGNLDDGTYRLAFFPDDYDTYAQEYYNNKPTLAAAGDIVITSGRSAGGKNVRLARAGSISGKVDVPTGRSASDILVEAYRLEDGTYQPYGGYFPDRDGRYVFDGLAAGTYRLGFFDYSGTIASEFYADSPTLDAAVDVDVIGGHTTLVGDAQLDYAILPPTGLHATAQTSTSVTLGWTKNADAVQYKISFVPTSGGPRKYRTIGDVSSYEVTGLSPGVEYTFSIASINDDYALSAYSPEVTATTN